MSDVEALRYAAGLHAMTCNDNPGHQDWHDCATTGPCADEGRRLASVLALIPAPHPQGGTEHGSACNDGIRIGDGPVYECHGECIPEGGTEALRAAVETWRARLLASTTFWVDDLAAHDVARQLTNLLDSEDCPHLAESGDEGPVADLRGGWPVRWRCDGCNRVRYDDAALADLRARGGVVTGEATGTDALRLIVALHAIYPTSGLCGVCGTYWPCDTVMLARPGEIAARAKLVGFWEGHPELAALLAAPAPTEGDPYCICGGGADHDDDCPRAPESDR